MVERINRPLHKEITRYRKNEAVKSLFNIFSQAALSMKALKTLLTQIHSLIPGSCPVQTQSESALLEQIHLGQLSSGKTEDAFL